MRWILFLVIPIFAVQAESDEEALFLRRIADFWQEGEYQIAKTQIEEFIVEYPESPFSDALCSALGDLFLREKNYSNALNYYSQVQSAEFVQKVFLNRMQCLYEMQWYATLADECEAYLSEESNMQVTYFLAIALYHQCINASKETDQLIKLGERARPYFEALYESELSEEIAQGYAHLLCILKDYTKATEVYYDLAQKNPGNAEEMLFQVALIQSEYDKAAAFQTFDHIVQRNGQRSKEASYNRMVLAFELGLHESLVATDLEQIPADRLDTARLFLGRSLLQMKKYPEAAEELKAYIQNAPVSETLFAALLSLLDASYQTDDLATFDEAIDKLATNYPGNQELKKAYFSRAQILKRLDRLQEAKAELENLLAHSSSDEQRSQVLFELTHLDYKSKDWASCYKQGFQFLNAFKEHELALFVWRYFISSSAEIAMQKPEHRKQLVADLDLFLRLPLTQLEKNEWELLLAKTYYEMHQFEEAIARLKLRDTPNAQLLLSLCLRDGHQDVQGFCTLAEEALKNGANLVDPGQIHASLYNAFLDLSNLEKAAQHLYEAFMAKAEIKTENLLWLAEHYLSHLYEEEGNFVLAARTASLFAKCKAAIQNPKKDAFSGTPSGECKAALHLADPLVEDAISCKLAKVYGMLGRIDDAIATLESLENPSQEAQLLLAENYVKKGIVEQAVQIFDAIVSSSGTLRSPIAAAAAFQGAKIKLSQNNPNHSEIALCLKNLILQKNFEEEPLYLEAALEYVDLVAKKDPQKKKSLLQKTKQDFEQCEDLLSKDYHAAREKSAHKNLIYQGYMKLIDAEILQAEAKIDGKNKQELEAKSKNLLLQIMEKPIVSSLKERVQKLLADET